MSTTGRFWVSTEGGPDLAVTSISSPPATALPSGRFAVTSTVTNQGTASASASRLRFYLSIDGLKDSGDVLMAPTRSTPSLAAGAASTSTVTVTVPAAVPSGVYRLLACADDLDAVGESDETDNCLASASSIAIQAPNLTVTAVSDPPTAAARGSRFTVTDTVANQGTAAARSFRIRYYLSPDAGGGGGGTLMSGTRFLGALAAGASSTGSVSVTIPFSTAPGTYLVRACADDTDVVRETVETDNCRPSAGAVVVSP